MFFSSNQILGVKHIILDFDGALYNTQEVGLVAHRRTSQKYEIEISEKFWTQWGGGNFRYIFAAHFPSHKKKPPDIIRAKDRCFYAMSDRIAGNHQLSCWIEGHKGKAYHSIVSSAQRYSVNLILSHFGDQGLFDQQFSVLLISLGKWHFFEMCFS